MTSIYKFINPILSYIKKIQKYSAKLIDSMKKCAKGIYGRL